VVWVGVSAQVELNSVVGDLVPYGQSHLSMLLGKPQVLQVESCLLVCCYNYLQKYHANYSFSLEGCDSLKIEAKVVAHYLLYYAKSEITDALEGI
jgi:hypothetical protein